MKKRNSILENFTATKDRSQKFQLVVLILFATAILIAFTGLILIAIS